MKKRSYLILFCLLAVLSTLNACPGRKGPDRPPDTIPPAVSDTAPRNLDTNVAPNAAISVTFSEPVLAGTVQFGLALVNGGGSVPCTMSYSGNAAVCTPDQPLEYSTAYQATVSGARDMSGNQMAGEYQWNFTTSASPDTTPPRVVEVQPAKDTTSASSTSAVSIIFSEPMDPTTISESTVLLSTFATGSALVGTVSYNGALSAATFVPGILLAHNTDYLVTVGTNARDLAKNKMTNAFTSRFRTAAADDATPPSVTAMYPAPNAANADVDTPITVTFSEPMSAETITPGNVLVSEGTSTIPIPVDIKLIGTTVVVTPIKPLKFSTVYTVTVPAAVTDLAGHPMATDFASSFTTIAQSPDNVQPYVLSTFPANGDSSVPVYRQVVALFSETMLASSITPATFLLMGPNGIVSGQITVTGALAALTPDQPLDPATQYTAVVTSGVTDLVGNSLTPPAGISWSFTTEPVETHTITATAGSNGHISPSGAITVGYDTSKAFSITPNTGYHIFDVQVDGSSVGSAPTYTFNNVTADHTISAFFQINTYTVTPSAGTNGGINPSVPQTVNYNTTTQFTVTPSAGYNTVMGGTCGGALVGNTYTTNAVKNDCTVTALFSLGTVTVTSSVSGGNGSISPNGAQAVPYGSTPSFTLTPLTGYHASVGGTCGGTLSPDGLTFTTNPAIASCTVIASFSINTFTIATSVSGGTGTVTPVNPSVNSGGNQTISITPGTGYHITDVQVDGSSAGVPTSVTFNNVTTNHTVSALFTLNTLTITSSATGNGTVTPLGPTPVLYGGSQTFTFTPNSPAYVIASVVVDGISQGLPNSWTFNNVTINHTISVTFQLGTNLITATSGTNGTINSNGTIVSAGSSQDFLISSGGTRTFTFVPNTGYLISNVQVDGVSQGAISSYTFTNVMANHTISAFFAAKTVATVTLGSLNQVYNGAPQVATATTTPAGLNVTFTYNGSSTAPTNAGNYAVVGTINDPTYQGSASGTLVISKATATVTLGSLNQTYDGTQKSASATTNPVGLSVTFTYNGLPTAPAVAGNYNVVGTVNDANYQGSAIGTLAIAKAATSVTWANPSAITYGTALSGTQLNATPSVAGNLVYTPASGTILNAGTNQTLSVTFTPNDTANYTGSSANVQITVATRPITVTADAKTKVYGAVDPALTYQITSGSLVGSDTLSGALTRAAGENVGNYAIQLGSLTNSNYQITFVSANLSITAKPITVTADAKTKVYGASDPAFTYTTSGLVGSDTLSGALTRVTGEAIGTYAIQQGSLANSNYQITFNTANLTITVRPITVTADAKTKTYGASDPALTYTITSGSLAGSDTLSGALTRVAGETVGTYAIQQGSLSAGSNYALTYVGANLSITARLITVSADAKSKVFGASDPALTYTITSGSLINGDSFTGALTRVGGENVGTYAIQQGSLSAGINYVITYNGANLTITKADQTITFSLQSTATVGDPPITLTATASSGLAVTYSSDNTDVAAISGNTVVIMGAGTANITASQAGNGNYNAAPNVVQPLNVSGP